MMKFVTATLLCTLCMSAANAASLTFAGNPEAVWSEKPSASTGLDEIYVLATTSGVTASYVASSASPEVTVSVWGHQGAAYAEELPSADVSRSGATVTVGNLRADTGYAFTENGRTSYFWIVDYSNHPFAARELNLSPEQECGRAWLDFNGSAEPITYYGINARSWTLSRDIDLTYETLAFDSQNFAYIQVSHTEELDRAGDRINVEAPLCDTQFTLTGDRFLRFWGREQSVTSPRLIATTVAAETRAIQAERDPSHDHDNEIKVETDGIGGSAPVEVTFEAAVTDAAIFREWQISHDEDFYDITTRIRQLDFTQTFNEMGTYYVRFTAANSEGGCEVYSDPVKVYIGESLLQCPNAFSPGVTEGVNDEWRVSYKSIISFECYIFNRWGQKLAEFTDPSLGWDGRYKGKIVPPGVYYYVIKATGSDGRKYDLAGDINIVGYSGDRK